MEKITIAGAISALNPLLNALEDAYWDSSEVTTKDRLFALVRCVSVELTELAKLSVDDHDLPYENITPQFGASCVKLRQLSLEVPSLFPRERTATKLDETLNGASELLTRCLI